MEVASRGSTALNLSKLQDSGFPAGGSSQARGGYRPNASCGERDGGGGRRRAATHARAWWKPVSSWRLLDGNAGGKGGEEWRERQAWPREPIQRQDRPLNGCQTTPSCLPRGQDGCCLFVRSHAICVLPSPLTYGKRRSLLHVEMRTIAPARQRTGAARPRSRRGRRRSGPLLREPVSCSARASGGPSPQRRWGSC